MRLGNLRCRVSQARHGRASPGAMRTRRRGAELTGRAAIGGTSRPPRDVQFSRGFKFISTSGQFGLAMLEEAADGGRARGRWRSRRLAGLRRESRSGAVVLLLL